MLGGETGESLSAESIMETLHSKSNVTGVCDYKVSTDCETPNDVAKPILHFKIKDTPKSKYVCGSCLDKLIGEGKVRIEGE